MLTYAQALLLVAGLTAINTAIWVLAFRRVRKYAHTYWVHAR